jgi:hypothetical protein
MQCIRCGSQVVLQGRMYVTDGGDYVCPASGRGEASVHRVGERPEVLPKRKPMIPRALQALLWFGAGRVVGNVAVGNYSPPKAQARLPQPPQ